MILSIGKTRLSFKVNALNEGRGKRAFSLVELLVAIVILSIGIVTALQALSAASRIAALSSDIVNATFLIENKMQEWQYKEKHRLIAKEPLTAEQNLGKFSWHTAINLSRDLNLYQLNSNLSWERANRQEKINLNTYLDNENE